MATITSAEVFVTCPGRNYVTLKITTSDGVTGIGDATLNGRELSVASYLRDHVCPTLIGKDPARIEQVWQYLYKGAYWRRGPVTMTAIAAVDVALWDIKGKVAGLPVYQLLGGAARDGVTVYGHASGNTVPELLDDVQRFLDKGFRAVRAQAAVPGLERVYGMRKGDGDTYEAGRRGAAHRGGLGHRRLLGLRADLHVRRPRAVRLRLPPAARRAPPAHPHRGGPPGQVPRALPPVLDRGPHAGRGPGGLPPHPAAHHDTARRRRDLQLDLGLPAPDHEPPHRLHPHVRLARGRHHAPAQDLLPRRVVRGPLRLARRGRPLPASLAAALHVDLSIPNFGMQEYMAHLPGYEEVFETSWTFEDGLMHPGDRPGIGVEFDEKAAERFPYERKYLPVNRLRDGSVHDW